MSESDFARERAEREEPERWRLERMRLLDAAALRMWREALMMLLEWKARRA